ncbi:hypothetical protein SAMN05428642_1011326 [Flaviramulus basaltis]|uniref:Lipoprotein n=1 Tax=Flaviramulus basaltis TaxID=369401 RepID=A0A1K2IFE8_9FLAO|nr:hypothetical protein [Flaviramulus basaltis]SFZ90998.1 hypothetical protein SAMN05428642_1011326 [Flaviramulus basaltis]
MKNYFFLILFIILASACSGTKNTVKHSFSKEEVQIIMTADSLKPMRVYKITNNKDSLLLRKKALI